MPIKNVDCPVEGPLPPYGVFANAFRLSLDGSEILLDFCVYSETENSASVVARVRVSQDFLPVIQKKIGSSLSPIPQLFILPSGGEA